MRIAYVTSIHPDFDARVWKYAVTMARCGHQVSLICPWDAKNGEVREGVTLRTFPRAKTRMIRPFSIPWGIGKRLIALLREVELIHFHDLDILPLMAGLALFKPVVYDVHENYPDEMLVRQWIPKPMRRPLYHCVSLAQAGLSRIVHNAVFVIPEIGKHFPDNVLKTAIIRNYATLDLLQDRADNYRERADTVVFIGSNYEGNGTLLFLEIAARFKARNSQLRFLMTDRWSDSSIRARSLAFIRIHGLTNVTITPNLPPHRIMEHLNRATIGIAPALRQTKHMNALPTKLFEYMAAGLPIVSSDLPNEAQLARETGAILLCRPEEPEAFVDAIEKLLQDRDYAHDCGQKGQSAFRDRFCWESQAEIIEKFYRDILEAKSRSVEPEVNQAGT